MRRAHGSEIPGSATNGEETEPMTAYVLVQTATQDGRIANLLRRVPGIVFAEDVRGPYDALALVRSDVGTPSRRSWIGSAGCRA